MGEFLERATFWGGGGGPFPPPPLSQGSKGDKGVIAEAGAWEVNNNLQEAKKKKETDQNQDSAKRKA
ncbi:predicted protein [Histoplasma capsulatum var. duboisii H88]|uniref:Predicted protein n=1 Tax=Ajellomyces capsulatus (strain H88) TaxID=544711 RepID=F0UG68_AJEC8|nr:predicted protein [Histoplasma capsulatum var. duboisii H88]